MVELLKIIINGAFKIMSLIIMLILIYMFTFKKEMFELISTNELVLICTITLYGLLDKRE